MSDCKTCSINVCDDPPDYELYSLQGIVPPTPGTQPVTPPVVVPVFGNFQTSCRSTCPNGGTYTFFVDSNAFTASTQSAADNAAQAFACQRAEQSRVCLSSISIVECHDDAYSANITGPPSTAVFELVETEPDPTETGFAATGLTFTPNNTLPPSADITGSPGVDAYGKFYFTVRATEPSGNFAERAYFLWFAGITTTSLPVGTVGVAYSATLSQRGLDGVPFNSSGTLDTPRFVIDPAFPLPAGLSMSTDGVITGTPNGSGTTAFVVNYGFYVVDGDPSSLLVICDTILSITVQPTPAIETETLTKACQGTAYNVAVSHPSIPVPTTWAFSTADATEIAEKAAFQATGLDLITAAGPTFGHITGTAIAGSGTNGISVTLKYDNGGTPVKHRITLAIFEITTTSLPQAIIGQAYGNQQIAFIGGGAVTWSITAGALPSGLSLNATTGIISGTPTTGATTQTFTVRATQGLFNCSKQLSIAIGAIITTASLPAGAVNSTLSNYSSTLQSTGFSAAQWSITAGALPVGLTLNSSTGTISGLPQRGSGGVASFTVRASEGGNPAKFVEKNFTITIVEVVMRTLPSAIIGQSYNQTVQALGSPTSWGVRANPDLLPPGLTVSNAGVISGTLGDTAQQSFNFGLTASLGGASNTALSIFSIAIAGITTPAFPSHAKANNSYVLPLTTVGMGPATSITWTAAGDIPSGMSLKNRGGGNWEVSGSPTVAMVPGPHYFTVTAISPSLTTSKQIAIYVDF